MPMKASGGGGVLVVSSDPLFEEINELKEMMKTLLSKIQGQTPASEGGAGWMKKKEACTYMKMSTAEFQRKRKTAAFPFEERQLGERSFIYRPKPGY